MVHRPRPRHNPVTLSTVQLEIHLGLNSSPSEGITYKILQGLKLKLYRYQVTNPSHFNILPKDFCTKYSFAVQTLLTGWDIIQRFGFWTREKTLLGIRHEVELLRIVSSPT